MRPIQGVGFCRTCSGRLGALNGFLSHVATITRRLTARFVADAFVELRISNLAGSSNFASLQFNPLASALQRMSTMLVLMI